MTQYNELYQQTILEHNKKPRNFAVLEEANHYALGKNPVCGDQFAVYAKVNDEGVIEDVSFQGSGCAISKASASLMTMIVKGKHQDEALQLKNEFQQMVTGQLDPANDPHHLGRLAIFAGVKEYPVRVKCATLAWHALDAALTGTLQEVTTED